MFVRCVNWRTSRSSGRAQYPRQPFAGPRRQGHRRPPARRAWVRVPGRYEGANLYGNLWRRVSTCRNGLGKGRDLGPNPRPLAPTMLQSYLPRIPTTQPSGLSDACAFIVPNPKASGHRRPDQRFVRLPAKVPVQGIPDGNITIAPFIADSPASYMPRQRVNIAYNNGPEAISQPCFSGGRSSGHGICGRS